MCSVDKVNVNLLFSLKINIFKTLLTAVVRSTLSQQIMHSVKYIFLKIFVSLYLSTGLVIIQIPVLLYKIDDFRIS